MRPLASWPGSDDRADVVCHFKNLNYWRELRRVASEPILEYHGLLVWSERIMIVPAVLDRAITFTFDSKAHEQQASQGV